MSMNVKSPSPPFIFVVKKCDPPPGSSKIYSDPPLPPDKHGLWLDCATIPGSFTQTHLLARITQPPIAYFSAIIVYPGPFNQLIFLFTSLSFESFSSELLVSPNSSSSSTSLSESSLTLTSSSDWVSVAAVSAALNVQCQDPFT